MSYTLENVEKNKLVCILSIALIILSVLNFIRLPKNKQLEKVKQWLLIAVTEAEKVLGSGTGRLKLSYVYDLFVTKFPWLAKIVPFETFSTLVDEVLEDMRKLIEANPNVNEYVNIKWEFISHFIF